MKYRVGDKVYELEGGKRKTRATVISASYGRYELRHDISGFETFAGRSASQMELIKRAGTLELGDKVRVKKNGRVGIVMETTERGGKITEIRIDYSGTNHRFPHTPKEVVLLRRDGEEKEVGPYNGKLVRIIGKGSKRHGFRIGDTCRVDDYMLMMGKAMYLLIRESDGFEQVVSESAFELIAETQKFTPAEKIIEMVRMDGAPITFQDESDRTLEFVHRWANVRGERNPLWMKRENQSPWIIDGYIYAPGSEFHVAKTGMPGDKAWAVRAEGKQFQVLISNSRYNDLFEHDIESFATDYPARKEDREDGETMELAKHDEAYAEMNRKIAELEQKNEQLRKEKVEQEYGEVTERHLWAVTVVIPKRTKFMPRSIPQGVTEQTTEIVTENKNMVEAAMVAEGMAKGISDDAFILEIKYQRVLGAIK